MLRLASTLLLMGSLVNAAPITSCADQQECMTMTINQVSTSGSTPCTSSQSPDCAFEVCMKVDYSLPGCDKAVTDTVSHTCLPDALACGGGTWTEKTSVASGFSMCQTGRPGQTLNFLLKDGNGCARSATLPAFDVGSGAMASCAPRTAAVRSCTGNDLGVECIWSVTLPACRSIDGNAGIGETDDGTGAAETGNCIALEEQIPDNMLVYDSGAEPSCNIGEAMDMPELKECDCVRPYADCQFLQCSKPIPDDVLGKLRTMEC